MKAIIIGSEGFVGRNLSLTLRKRGFSVTGFSSSRRGGIDPVTGLLPEGFSIQAGTDAVFYLAQSPYYHSAPEKSSNIITVNVVTAVRAAELSRRANVKRFIYASTGSVYAPSFGPVAESSPLQKNDWYVLSKIHAEEALSLYRNDLDITVIRPFGIYGPGQSNKLVPNIIGTVTAGKGIYIQGNPNDPSDKDGLRISLCYIDDLTGILCELIGHSGLGCINIAGDCPISIRRIASYVAGCLEKEAVFKMTGTNRASDLIADITLLKKRLNPHFTGFEQGLAKTVEWELAGRA